MFTADQLVAHAVGDYLLQSEWMAVEKTKRSLPALIHCLFYLIPFLFITQNPATLAVIGGTHFVIDRWHLARYVAWLKNRPWPGSAAWPECRATGFHPDTPPWMATWLVIIIDNVMAFVGSPNLTGAGLGSKHEDKRNFEAGFLFDDQQDIQFDGSLPRCVND